MNVEVEEGKILNIDIIGGCSGNLQGISRLLVGMSAEEAIARMSGVRCGGKPTSCPDQLAKALEVCLKNDKK
jgi:uncharacterized protein (TIGR03905 family)